MKKFFILLFCCFFTGVAHAAILGHGIYFDANDEFLTAFANCTPYRPVALNQRDLAKNEMPEEYNSIEIKYKQNDLCVFDLIMHLSSANSYSKTIKRCKITAEQQKRILEAIQNISNDKGKQYLKEIAAIMDQCRIVSEVYREYPQY